MGIRNVQLNNKNHAKIARSLSLIKFVASIGVIEYSEYLDIDFKNPIIHNKLNQTVNNLNYVVGEIDKRYLNGNNSDEVEDVSFTIHELLRNIMRLDTESLREFSGMVEAKVKLTDSQQIITG